MTLAVAIVLADALGTPVNHTFAPLGRDPKTPNMFWFEDQAGAASIGWNRISIELVRDRSIQQGATSKDRTNRVKIGIHTPKLETLGTADNGFVPSATVAYVPRCNIEFIMSDRAVIQDRKDLRKYAQFLLADTQVVSMVETFINLS